MRRIGEVTDNAIVQAGELKQLLEFCDAAFRYGREDTVVAIFIAHHAVAEAINGAGIFGRHVARLLEAVEAWALLENLRDDVLLGDALDQIAQDQPMMVPGDDLSGPGKQAVPRPSGINPLLANRDVKVEYRQMGLRDDEVFIVATIADQREGFRAARKIISETSVRPAGPPGTVLPMWNNGQGLLPSASPALRATNSDDRRGQGHPHCRDRTIASGSLRLRSDRPPCRRTMSRSSAMW